MDRLLPDLKASPRATPRPVTRPWSLAHTTLRKHYAYEEGFNAWDGDILDAPPGSISTATESVQRQRGRAPMNQERSYHGLSSSPSLASPPLHASPSLGMLGLDNTESTPSRTLSPSATLAKPPPLRLIGEEDTEPPSPTFYFEGSPCVDRFERDLKLAQLNRDQRIEIRLMMELSTSSLQDMLGLSAEEMNEVQDEGSVDELEAAAATLRRDPGKSHQYDEDLGTYRRAAYEAQISTRKALQGPVKINRSHKQLHAPADELGYLDQVSDEEEEAITRQYLQAVKSKGWNRRSAIDDLRRRNLLPKASNPAEASADEQPNGKGPTRPGKEGGSGADPPWDLGGFSAVLGRMPSDAVAGPQLQAEPSSFEVPSSSQDLTPTLWNAAYLRPPTAYQPKSSRGTKDLFRPRIQGRLSPVLLLQVPAIGNRLLQENLRRLLLGKSRPISRQDAIPTGCGLCLSQLEELMLRDASKIPGWKLGPQEPGLFEREANKLAQGLHGEKLRTRVLGVFSLCQLAKRAVAEPSFPSRGHCVLHLVNANVSAFDIPGILHILSWPVAKIQAASAVLEQPAGSSGEALPWAGTRNAAPGSSARERRAGSRAKPPPARGIAGQHKRLSSRAVPSGPLSGSPEGLGPSAGQKHQGDEDSGPGLEGEYSFRQCDPLREVPPLELDGAYVTKLVLAENILDDEACAAMSLGIRELPHLRHLDVSGNSGLTWRACAALAELLATSNKVSPRLRLAGSGKARLQHLDVSGNPVGDRGIALLADSLKQNRFLRRLMLNRCGITQVGAHHLGWVVNENQALEELQLGWNRLFFRGGAEIAAGLRNNSCLKALDVRSNGLKDKGAAYFGNALVENKTLTSIDLSGNSIRSGGCLVLAEAIQNNSTLTTLLLNDNPLGGEGGNHLLIALAENKTLTRFGIQGSSFVDVHGPPASSDRGDARESFSRRNPNGNYDLQLGDPTHRQVALELWRMRQKQGANTWSKVKLNGKTVVPTDEWGWPDRIPEEGNLQLRFDTVMAPPGNAEPMQDENFENIRKELYNVGANDQWRLTVLRLVCGTHYFTSHQANVLVRCCSWSRERVEACTILFGRIVDPQNIDRFTAALSSDEKRDLHSRLGMLAFFRPDNPTAHYSLNLSRQLDRVIAARLLVSSVQEGYWRHQPILANFRNVAIDGEPVFIKEPDKFDLPYSGLLTFDYITYKFGTVLEGKKKFQENRKMYAPIDALRFETLLKALEVLKNVEIEIKARRSERRSTHASAAAGSSSPSTEAGASKASGASSQPGQPAGSSRNPKTGTPMSGFRLDLKAKKVQGAETALEDSDQDDQDADEIDLNSARMQPTSVMELFHELEQQVEAEKAADEQASLESDGNETAQEALEEGAREPLPVSKKSVKAISSRPGEHLGGSVELKKVKVESPGRKRWASTLHKVRGMNLAKEHLAGLFDQSLPNCTPVELLRSFGGLHYVTCKQVLMICSLFNYTSDLNGPPDQQKVTIIQMLFTRLADTYHFADLIRSLDKHSQLVLNRRLGYHNTILTSMRKDFSHLHGLHFRLRFGVEDEHLCMKKIAEYVAKLPNKPSSTSGEVKAMLRDLRINGEPASVAEDSQLWKTLLMVGKERKKPNSAWDSSGTAEFQLMFPDKWLKAAMVPKIQNAWTSYRHRKVARKWKEVLAIQTSKVLRENVAPLLISPR